MTNQTLNLNVSETLFSDLEKKGYEIENLTSYFENIFVKLNLSGANK